MCLLYYIIAFIHLSRAGKAQLVSYRLDGGGSIPDRGKICLLSIAYRPALGPTQPPIQRVLGGFFSGLNWPGREADQSPPSSAEIKNGGVTPSLRHTS
jgi:hypothetical protein